MFLGFRLWLLLSSVPFESVGVAVQAAVAAAAVLEEAKRLDPGTVVYW